MPTEDKWVKTLVQAGLQQTSLQGLTELAKVITKATNAVGSIIWEATQSDAHGAPVPSVLTAWFRDAGANLSDSRMAPDTLTVRAFQSAGTNPIYKGEPALSPVFSTSIQPAVLAIPLTFLDENRGVVTLYGRRRPSSASIGLVESLVSYLPQLCHTIRDRQTLELLHDCNNILHEADLESRDGPLEKDSVKIFLQLLCERVAQAFQCVDVSIFLEDRLSLPGQYSLTASSSDSKGVQRSQYIRPYDGITGWALATGNSVAISHLEQDLGAPEYLQLKFPGFRWTRTTLESEPDVLDSIRLADLRNACLTTLMAVPITTGTKVWGVLRCWGTIGPPYRFTDRDLPPINLTAAQVAQYWSNWLSRWTTWLSHRDLEAENRSWLKLADGITSLNRLVSQELRKSPPERRVVYREALRILHDVLPDAKATDIRHVGPDDRTHHLYFAEVRGEWWDLGTEVDKKTRLTRQFLLYGDESTSAGAQVYRTQESLALDDVAKARHYSSTFPQTKWLVVTPIRVSDEVYGVLDARGATESLPASVKQVAEILGDQLGLYLHLERTIGNLFRIERRLKETLEAQAQAFEDLEHQLVSPLLSATARVEQLLHHGRFDSRTDSTLRAIRGLCKKAATVAMSVGVFASLAKGQKPSPVLEPLGEEDLIRLLISAAVDTELLIDPDHNKRVEVDRDGLRVLGRQLLWVDLSFLEQCLRNILDNAAKYCYHGTTIAIFGRVENRHLTLGVRNQGIAIPSADLGRVKERGWRGTDAKASTGEGSGLGLWIADHLMRSMSGNLSVMPEGEFTTVELRFRLREERALNRG
jgi:signal transduction histidine kinase